MLWMWRQPPKQKSFPCDVSTLQILYKYKTLHTNGHKKQVHETQGQDDYQTYENLSERDDF